LRGGRDCRGRFAVAAARGLIRNSGPCHKVELRGFAADSRPDLFSYPDGSGELAQLRISLQSNTRSWPIEPRGKKG
jgi:hypothetical protein